MKKIAFLAGIVASSTAGVTIAKKKLRKKPTISKDSYLLHLELFDWLDKAPANGYTAQEIHSHFKVQNEFIEMINKLENSSGRV